MKKLYRALTGMLTAALLLCTPAASAAVMRFAPSPDQFIRGAFEFTEKAPVGPEVHARTDDDGGTAIPKAVSPAAQADPEARAVGADEADPLPGDAAAAPAASQPTPIPGRLAGLKIGIDPGHQARGNSQKEAVAPGSREMKAKVSDGTEGVRTGIPEYVTVLEIAFKLRDCLLAEDAQVFMTRETHDVDISNQERARLMNNLGCDLVLRIHCDGSDNRDANGIGLFVNESFPISAESRRAAQCILPRMVEATGAKARDVFDSDGYTGLNWSDVPCILVECGFLSNPDEDVRLNDSVYQYKLASGMVEGICDFFGR